MIICSSMLAHVMFIGSIWSMESKVFRMSITYVALFLKVWYLSIKDCVQFNTVSSGYVGQNSSSVSAVCRGIEEAQMENIIGRLKTICYQVQW